MVTGYINAHSLSGDRDYLHKVFLIDILKMRSSGNYVIFQTLNKRYIKKGTLKDMEERFCQRDEFNRIHHSFIISKGSIQSVGKDSVVLVTGSSYPVSRSRKRAFNRFRYKGD